MRKPLVSCTLLTVITCLLFAIPVRPCTVAVISGKATPDGRPLLWKNRDTHDFENKVVFIRGQKYDFIGIINTKDTEIKQVWAGTNSAGLCVMNSALYNVNIDAQTGNPVPNKADDPRLREGALMRLALETCATVDEFEQLLNSTAGNRAVAANFGVIDATGGASIFETDNAGHTRFDANDPKVAPEGYILRTNFSFTGKPNAGSGYIRYDRAGELVHAKVPTGLTPEWILNTVGRDMVNGLTGINPLAEPLPAHALDSRLYFMNDSLARPSATCAVVFQGVLPDEDPVRTIMWTRLGHPLCSVTLPIWVAGGENLGMLTGAGEAPLDRFALDMWAKIYPYKGGNRGNYLDLAPAVNAAGTGILTRLIKIEHKLYHLADRLLGSAAKLDRETVIKIQVEMETRARELLRQEFGACAEKAGI